MQCHQVVTTVLEGGRRVPVLFCPKTMTPVVSAMLFMTIRREGYPFRTALRDARVIGWFFDWWGETHSEPERLESLLLGGGVPAPDEIADFSNWLRHGRGTVVGKEVVHASDSRILLAKTLDDYLLALEGFLKWILRRYGDRRHSHGTAVYEALSRLKEEFEAARIRGRSPDREYGLERTEIAQLVATADPSSKTNPFRTRHRLRNYLIFELLYQTGIRRGELLKLHTTDFLKDADGLSYLVIVHRRNDVADTRRVEPGQKTTQRRVPLSSSLHTLLETYVTRTRRPIRNGRPQKLLHSYLFVSERGRPLAESQVNYVLSRIAAATAANGTRLHPHLLRTTFCIETMDYFVDALRMDEAAAKDRLREYCGWSASSVMPERYTKQRIRREATEALRRRHSSTSHFAPPQSLLTK